jgi:hypothetical protein
MSESIDNRKICMDICSNIEIDQCNAKDGKGILQYLETKMPSFKFNWHETDTNCVSIDCGFNKEDEKYLFILDFFLNDGFKKRIKNTTGLDLYVEIDEYDNKLQMGIMVINEKIQQSNTDLTNSFIEHLKVIPSQ